MHYTPADLWQLRMRIRQNDEFTADEIKVIAMHPGVACDYSKYIAKGRFEMAEPALAIKGYPDVDFYLGHVIDLQPEKFTETLDAVLSYNPRIRPQFLTLDILSFETLAVLVKYATVFNVRTRTSSYYGIEASSMIDVLAKLAEYAASDTPLRNKLQEYHQHIESPADVPTL